VSRFHALLSRFSPRPPSGPLTTSEQGDADKLKQETLEEDQRIERERQQKTSSPGEDDSA